MTLGGRGTGSRFDVLGVARFLTFSCIDRRPLFIESSSRGVFTRWLDCTRNEMGLALFAWVLMPDHAHLLILPNHPGDTRIFVQRLKARIGRELLTAWRRDSDPRLALCVRSDGRTGIWQPGGGYDRTVRDAAELREKIAYIHSNPVKRGLVSRESDWEWSSAGWYAGAREHRVEIDRVPW